MSRVAEEFKGAQRMIKTKIVFNKYIKEITTTLNDVSQDREPRHKQELIYTGWLTKQVHGIINQLIKTRKITK